MTMEISFFKFIFKVDTENNKSEAATAIVIESCARLVAKNVNMEDICCAKMSTRYKDVFQGSL